MIIDLECRVIGKMGYGISICFVWGERCYLIFWGYVRGFYG